MQPKIYGFRTERLLLFVFVEDQVLALHLDVQGVPTIQVKVSRMSFGFDIHPSFFRCSKDSIFKVPRNCRKVDSFSGGKKQLLGAHSVKMTHLVIDTSISFNCCGVAAMTPPLLCLGNVSSPFASHFPVASLSKSSNCTNTSATSLSIYECK
ncbi:hypothetical protein NQ317_009731 [Molorchus minor]|uniref:Uncharacterized protein n=1 Tax=Molorchus minor TaxID=1323400 RepID=A0ABQ9JDJ7_9CUCU|nr:hypothetical protein NQ317_009731 [Molorchus minor]